MDDARFWSVVAALGPELVPGRLAMILNSLSPPDLDGFCAQLDAAETALDTSEHRVQAGAAYELGSPEGVQRGWTTSDEPGPADFDDLRATVVAHGRDTWRAVVAVPLLLSGGWPTGLGRQLLLAVANAVRASLPSPQPV